MDNAKQHWKILQKLENDLANRVRSFLVIGSGGEGVIVTTEDGKVHWLGVIQFGMVEKKITVPKLTPLNVPNLVQMAQGNRHILLLNKRGEIYSMGANDSGQLGLGTVDRETILFSPQLIPISQKFISVRCGYWHSVALTDDGKCWAWGLNNYGQVGKPKSTLRSYLPSPQQISELDSHRIVAIECGGSYCLALTDQGEVYGWGSNGWGQLGELGDGSESSDYHPKLIPTASPVRSMAAGSYHTLLLTHTGVVYACGWNNFGQLGLPTSDTQKSFRLSRVPGLPPISQIASHTENDLSIAMSFEQRCFVWGEFSDRTSKNSIPKELPPNYSTVESPLSLYSTDCSTPNSVFIPETPTSLSARMSRMFDNPETSSDVQFVVEQRTINAHRIILSNSSDYFAGMFSERRLPQVDPIVKVTIPDHSYPVFHAFLRFLYTDCLEVNPNLLPDLFEMANQYHETDLHLACLSRMRTTLTPATCCLYYQLNNRHSLLPELVAFQQELLQFISTNFLEVIKSAAYQSLDAELCKKLTLYFANHFP